MTFEDFAERLEPFRRLVVRRKNDFLWTGWQDAVEALADIDATRAALILERPEGRKRAVLLFSSDGPLHRLAIDSGWEDAFWQYRPQPVDEQELHMATFA